MEALHCEDVFFLTLVSIYEAAVGASDFGDIEIRGRIENLE